MGSTPVEHTPLGHQAFDWLKAEREAAWLEHVFVRPPDFEVMAGSRSIVVFGAGGVGKTALRIALAQYADRATDGPAQLVVDWRPSLPPIRQTGSQEVRACFVRVMDACALALLRYLGRRPGVFNAASPWVQETVIWFVHEYLRGDRTLYLSRLEEEGTTGDTALLRDLIARKPRPVLDHDAPEARVIAELASAIKRLGLAGIWIMVDGLEPWIEAEAGALAQMLNALFSTLALFEEPGFVMKIMAPAAIEASIAQSGGIARRRLDVYRLESSVEQLIAIVERRLAVASGCNIFHLDDLCDSKDLVAWLKRCGGRSAYAWLKLIRPLADVYITHRLERPLKIKQCAEILRNHPPILRLDLATERVFIDDTQLTELSRTAYRLLHYLYEHGGLCTRSELYYRVCRGLDYEPRSHLDQGWEEPSDWNKLFDTILWRLRKAIELDPKVPLYIITDRGRGVRLENVWRDV
jgi:hypothetical protein